VPSCDTLQHEAAVIARCLVGRDATPPQQQRYAAAVSRHGFAFAAREQRLWRRMLAHPRLYSAVDGALALVRPDSGIRQRGYIMLAVLEASPEHADLFLAVRRPAPLVVLTALGTAIAGASRTLLGLLVIAVTR
jgi:hypothetical protein